MRAGEILEEPQEGDRRIVNSIVTVFDPENPAADERGCVSNPGRLLQEFGPRYNEDGWALCGGGVWVTIDAFEGATEEVE